MHPTYQKVLDDIKTTIETGGYGTSVTSQHNNILRIGSILIFYLETEYRLFPPVTKFLDLFLRAGYFFNASD